MRYLLLHKLTKDMIMMLWPFNLQVPCILYIGQVYRYPPENAFYIFNRKYT